MSHDELCACMRCEAPTQDEPERSEPQHPGCAGCGIARPIEMARLTLALTEPEIRLILDHTIVEIVDFEEQPDDDEGRYEICNRIAYCTAGHPFAVNVWEMQALDDALAGFRTSDLTPDELRTYIRLIDALHSVEPPRGF